MLAGRCDSSTGLGHFSLQAKQLECLVRKTRKHATYTSSVPQCLCMFVLAHNINFDGSADMDHRGKPGPGALHSPNEHKKNQVMILDQILVTWLRVRNHADRGSLRKVHATSRAAFTKRFVLDV